VEFQVWKVRRYFSEEGGLFSFSLRSNMASAPVVLDQDQFQSLFPGFDASIVPEAPGKMTVAIDIRKVP